MYAALEVDPPYLLLLTREAELRKGDLHLHHPPQRVHAGRHRPHGIPGIVTVTVVVRRHHVRAHALRIGVEDERRSMVVVRVDGNPERVARRVAVTPPQTAGDRSRIRIVHSRRDVECAAVIDNADLGSLAGLSAVLRFGLREVAHEWRVLPRGIVEPAVQVRRLLDAHSGDDRRDATGVPQARIRRVGDSSLHCRRGLKGQREGSEMHRTASGWR